MDLDVSKLKPHELQAYYEIVNDCILWAEAFLINPDSGQPLRVNYVQRKILASRSKRTAIRVHRRAGKTYALTMFALWYALTHESGQVLIVCPDQAKVHTIFNSIDEFLRVSPLLKDCLRESTKTPALRKFANGSTISGFTAGSRSKNGAEVLRGQTADVVIVDEAAFLDKEDSPAIEPIMQGDATRPNVISFVSSTPTAERNRYWEMCTKPQDAVPKALQWRRIHVQVTDNPDYDKDRVTEIHAQVDDFTWKQEWLAIFPDIGEGVYKRSYIDRAKRDYQYYNPKAAGFTLAPAVRTMGVDWDKYNGTGPNIIIIEMDREAGVYKAMYHEEITPSEYCLTLATQRIIDLNAIFLPQYIYVDRGMAENQVEYLHLYGGQHPETGLSSKVRGVSFSENVEVLDPATRELVKKRIKPYMVNITVKWFEDNRFVYPKSHMKFTEQLQDFKVVSMTDASIKYSSENEHIIDAFMLAAYAMYANFSDPFAFRPATNSYMLTVPEVVTQRTHDDRGRPLGFGVIKDSTIITNNFGRRSLPPSPGRKLNTTGEGGIRKSF